MDLTGANWSHPLILHPKDIGFEILKTKNGSSGFSAKNETGFGIATHLQVPVTTGKKVYVKLALSIKSGGIPTLFFSPDPWANDPIFSIQLVDGYQEISFVPKKTGYFHPILKVRDGIKTEFTLEKFSIKYTR